MRVGIRVMLVASVAAGWLMTAPAVAGETEKTEIEGRLTMVWGDPPAGSTEGSQLRFLLTSDGGVTVRLAVGDDLFRIAGGPSRLNGRMVRVWLHPEGTEGTEAGLRKVAAIRVMPGADEIVPTRDISGSQPWVSVLCKFSNISSEPKNLAYFQDMFANTPRRLDHYWRELSSDMANVLGSTAVDWVVLPHPQSYYAPTPGSGHDANLGALFADCTAAADPYVDFSNGGAGGYAGINLMFNDLLDCCAWGGSHYALLDGVSKVWRTTWEPPWGYNNVCVMAHEMGHGFGLPHSNNWDGDGSPYDNSWDVMSDTWYYATSDPVYGTVGKHTIAYHKDVLGWIPAGERFVVGGAGVYTITIDDLALRSTPNYRMARIPIPGAGRFYTVEVRDRTGTYDGNLPGNAVIIHHVDPGRSEDAWAYDASVPPGDNSAGEGVMWRPGETFEDVAKQIRVRVDTATTNGFQVTIMYGAVELIFTDGFASGNTNAWTYTIE